VSEEPRIVGCSIIEISSTSSQTRSFHSLALTSPMNFFGHIINFKLLHERPRKKKNNRKQRTQLRVLFVEGEREEGRRKELFCSTYTRGSSPSHRVQREEGERKKTKLVNFSSSSFYDSSLGRFLCFHIGRANEAK
jgi:hypothetical protein